MCRSLGLAESSQKTLALQVRQNDIGLLENQLQTLQHHHDEQLRLVASLKNQVSDLNEKVTSAEQEMTTVKEALGLAQKELQASETKLAGQEGQLAVLDTLQSSVSALKETLHKEQERNKALEREKENLGKQLARLGRKSEVKETHAAK